MMIFDGFWTDLILQFLGVSPVNRWRKISFFELFSLCANFALKNNAVASNMRVF